MLAGEGSERCRYATSWQRWRCGRRPPKRSVLASAQNSASPRHVSEQLVRRNESTFRAQQRCSDNSYPSMSCLRPQFWASQQHLLPAQTCSPLRASLDACLRSLQCGSSWEVPALERQDRAVPSPTERASPRRPRATGRKPWRRGPTPSSTSWSLLGTSLWGGSCIKRGAEEEGMALRRERSGPLQLADRPTDAGFSVYAGKRGLSCDSCTISSIPTTRRPSGSISFQRRGNTQPCRPRGVSGPPPLDLDSM